MYPYELCIVIEALMLMVNQHFIHREDGIVSHDYTSSDEQAIELLVEKGYAVVFGANRYRLLWERLHEHRGCTAEGGVPTDRRRLATDQNERGAGR